MTRFVLLAFGITWLGVSPMVLSELGILPPLPVWLHGIGALGPVLAATFSPRARGVYASAGPPSMSSGWITVCLSTPLLLAAVSLALVAMGGQPVAAPLLTAAADPAWLVSLLVGSVLYGLGEEPGWRGWLQPHLQERHSPVVATLILTPIWAVWHTPFFFYRFDFEGPVTIVGFFVGLLAGAFWLAFLWNSTSSVWTVAVWHVLWNVANIALGAVSSTAVGILNGIMMTLGFGVALVWGRRGLRAGSRPGAEASP
jgi:membrane protease YdiL (CAAX protease family)